MELTQVYLKTILYYDPSTGIFLWRPRPISMFATVRSCKVWHLNYCGKEAGYIWKGKKAGANSNGYRIITHQIDGRNTVHRAHRLAFLYMSGTYPDNSVDHIDGNELNNEWTNLRDVHPTYNNRNARRPKDNKSGVIGVYWAKDRCKWTAQISDMTGRTKKVYCGLDLFEAVCARKQHERINGYTQRHGDL